MNEVERVFGSTQRDEILAAWGMSTVAETPAESYEAQIAQIASFCQSHGKTLYRNADAGMTVSVQ